MGVFSGLLKRMILVGGPPRSGTRLAAWILNRHPGIATAIDDHVYECWALYYYPARRGLVERLRKGRLSRRAAARILERHLVRDRHVTGVAASEKTAGFGESRPPQRPGFEVTPQDVRLVRYTVPLDPFFRQRHLCLKSPEISFVIPRLASIFPGARFVLVYRSVEEIAESMYRKGKSVKNTAVYHARWRKECDANGNLIAPPGVPEEWTGIWRSVSDFQRCVIYAASYLQALDRGLEQTARERAFVYCHADLRSHPESVLAKMARFLDVDPDGFQDVLQGIEPREPPFPGHLKKELQSISAELELEGLLKRIKMLDSHVRD